jgi:8-oxo-dGTP diphosphatase
MSRRYPDRPFISVGAVILREGRLLLVKRGSEPLKGEWSVPGGALELGETIRTGVEREVLEETGLKVIAGDVVAVLDRIYLDSDGRCEFHYVLVDMVCRLSPGEDPSRAQASADAEDVRWLTFAEVRTWPMQEPLREVLLRVIDDQR